MQASDPEVASARTPGPPALFHNAEPTSRPSPPPIHAIYPLTPMTTTSTTHPSRAPWGSSMGHKTLAWRRSTLQSQPATRFEHMLPTTTTTTTTISIPGPRLRQYPHRTPASSSSFGSSHPSLTMRSLRPWYHRSFPLRQGEMSRRRQYCKRFFSLSPSGASRFTSEGGKGGGEEVNKT